jgi:site-specific recombinase XerD
MPLADSSPLNAPSDVLSSAAEFFKNRSRSSATLVAYSSDWKDFGEWCAFRGVEQLPASPRTVANYLADLASSGGAKKSTVGRRLTAINRFHEVAGFARPGADGDVREVVGGIRRSLDADVDQAAPLVREMLISCVAALEGSDVLVARDRALLCVGFAAALRRSEIVALRVEHLRRVEQGVSLYIPMSKTDQEGRGQYVGLSPTCDERIDPVSALRSWLQVSQIAAGPVFRGLLKNHRPRASALNPASVNTIVKKAVSRVSLEGSGFVPDDFSGHSLRAGFVTSAKLAGVPDHVIANTTRHRDMRSLAVYARTGQVFENATTWAGW